MGWLRDSMRHAQPPVLSYGELARRVLENSGGSPDTRMQARSLAALFSKLDRQVELEWLRDRPAMQQAMARILGVPLRAIVGLTAEATESPHTFSLDELLGSPTLQLDTEELPPGFPALLMDPTQWGRVWWHAPPGSGRTLVGRWLAARGLAQFQQVETTSGQYTSPHSAPLFLEVHRSQAGSPNSTAFTAPVCIAAPYLPPVTHEWRILQPTPLREFSAPLIHWLGKRFPLPTPEALHGFLKWYSHEASPLGLGIRFGSILGLYGLCQRWGLTQLQRHSPVELALRYCTFRLLNLAEPNIAAPDLIQPLLKIAQNRLQHPNRTWDDAQSLEAWEFEFAELEPARTRHTLRLLESTGLLKATLNSSLTLGPCWFVEALTQEATRALDPSSWHTWGNALLSPHHASRVAEHIYRHFKPLTAHSKLPQDVDSLPEVAALEFYFRGAGLQNLQQRPIGEGCSRLWDAQLKLILEGPSGLPRPRVDYALQEPRSRWLEVGAWYLATLSLSEALSPLSHTSHPLLDPWAATEPHPGLKHVLDIILSWLEKDGCDSTWVVSVCALVHRLRGRVGAIGGVDTPHTLEVPGIVLDEVVHGVLSWKTVQTLAPHPCSVNALKHYAEQSGLTWPTVAEAIWDAWDRAERPWVGAEILNPEGEHSALFWPFIPADLLEVLLLDARQKTLPVELFSKTQWQAVARALFQGAALGNDPKLWQLAPLELVDRAVTTALLGPTGLRTVWSRSAERMLLHIQSALTAPEERSPTALRALLTSLPSERTQQVLQLIQAHSMAHTPEPTLWALRDWLYLQIAERNPHCHLAYAELARVEQTYRKRGQPKNTELF